MATTPVAGQHLQPARPQMLDRELLTKRTDLGASPRFRHDPTVLVGCDRTTAR
jgi:hypothetical protein